MNDEHYYQYAFSLADCRVRQIGQGVDPRFQVELMPAGPIAAVASRVGLDEFDVKRLQGETTDDIAWLNKVAVRHNEIIRQAAASSPVLPLRLGTIFQSKESLLATARQHQATVSGFLRALGDRQEWAVKLYVQENAVSRSLQPTASSVAGDACKTGREYLKQKAAEIRRHRQQQSKLHEEVLAVESQLAARAGHCQRIRPLSAALTGRREKMVFNAAYLLPPTELEPWLNEIEQTRNAIQEKGLLLEVSGPWPPYHFCPELTM